MNAVRNSQKIMFLEGNMSCCGGTERVLSIIANGLSGRGFKIIIVSLWGCGKSFFALEKEITLCWVEAERKRGGIAGNLQYLSEILRREEPEVLVDVDNILGCYSVFLKRKRAELYWISWDHFSFRHHFRKNRLIRRLARRIVIRRADRLVVLTDKDKESYERKMKPCCPVTRIYNPLPYKAAPFRQTERPFVFAAGRLTKEKGFDLLIRSWSLLEERYPQWSLAVAGEGEDRLKLERMVRREKLKRIYFIGRVSDIENYYKRAAFFVLPSRYEGFGMSLAEAMCFGLAAVSYDCPSGPGELITDKENGFLVPCGDTRRFSERMELLMRDKGIRTSMGDRARESVRRFQEDRILDEWERLLKLKSGRGKA